MTDKLQPRSLMENNAL